MGILTEEATPPAPAPPAEPPPPPPLPTSPPEGGPPYAADTAGSTSIMATAAIVLVNGPWVVAHELLFIVKEKVRV